MRTGIGCTVVAMIAATASAGDSSDLANSLEDFAAAQGANGWYYGYFDLESDPSEFIEMAFYGDLETAQKPLEDVWSAAETWNPTALVAQEWLRPNMSAGSRHDVARRWVSDMSGTVEISGEITMLLNNPLGDGVQASVVVDGIEVFTTIVGHGSGISSYNVLVNVDEGSEIDLRVSARENHFSDAVIFNARIDTIPAPASVALLGLGGLAAARRRR
ncbi:MAG: PEP-CTERM sorting domain-containing protein [Planctomycetota bacterium]